METSVGVILFRKEAGENMFLLLQYPAGHWDFVKGHKEEGETDLQTAVRESQEETGIGDMQFVDDFVEKIHYTYKNGHYLVHKQVTFLLAQTNVSDVNLSDEHMGFLWADYEHSMKQVTFDNARRVLSRARRTMARHGML